MKITPEFAAWTEMGQDRTAAWLTQRHGAAPGRITIGDDSITADEAYRLVSQGTAILWRGDFHNGRQLLQAVTRRIDAKALRHQRKPAKNDPMQAAPLELFNRHRLRQSQRATMLNRILVELSPGPDAHTASLLRLNLRRAPDVGPACQAALDPTSGCLLIPLRALLGYVGAYEWLKKGVSVSGLSAPIHVGYGVFSPNRGEYLDLLMQAPLPSNELAFDIGTGSGVLAIILAQRGVTRVIATDLDERALACAQQNVTRHHFDQVVQLRRADLFPQGKSPLIVCNPPWLPARPTTAIEQAIYDPDSHMLLGFLQGLAPRLEDAGEGWLIMSDLAEHLGLRETNFLTDTIKSCGLQVIDRLDTRPRHAKALDASDPLYFARRAEVTSLWRLGRR